MRGLLFPGDRHAVVEEFDDPVPGPGEVRIAMRAAAICGSDLHGYRATAEERRANGLARTIPGHEPAGIVDQVGSGVASVTIGDRVGVFHYRGCGHCAECVGGRLQWCPQRRGYGGAIHGSDADFLVTDERNCLKLPDDVEFETGALLMCVGGTAFRSIAKLDLRFDQTLAIHGLGPVGLTAIRWARATGVRIIGVDPSPERRRLAGELGATVTIDPTEDCVGRLMDASDGGIDAAFETSGSLSAARAAVASAARRGRIVRVGFGSTEPSINPSDLVDRELTLMGSFVFGLDDYAPMLGLMRALGEDLRSIITDRISLEKTPDFLPQVDHAQTGKVVITWP